MEYWIIRIQEIQNGYILDIDGKQYYKTLAEVSQAIAEYLEKEQKLQEQS